jgi:hypothetical protein
MGTDTMALSAKTTFPSLLVNRTPASAAYSTSLTGQFLRTWKTWLEKGLGRKPFQ